MYRYCAVYAGSSSVGTQHSLRAMWHASLKRGVSPFYGRTVLKFWNEKLDTRSSSKC